MSSDTRHIPASHAGHRTTASIRFFFAAHVALLLILLVGFTRSFYLRPLFSARPLPPVLYVHGVVLTTWFLLTVMQGWLIQTGRFQLHRRTGYAVAAYGTLVVIMGLAADLRIPAELHGPTDPGGIVFWGNLFSLVQFTTFVSLAVLFRKRPEVHKRLTLLASVSIVGPALARFADWPILPGGNSAHPLYAVGGLLVLYVSLIVYDLIVRRRPHPVSCIGALTFVASLAAAMYLALSGRGFALLHGA